MARQTMPEQLAAVRLAIANSRNSSQIMAALAEQGIDEAFLAQGEQLASIASMAVATQDSAVGRQTEATNSYRAAEAAARRAYQDWAQACRATLTPAQVQALQIKAMPKNAVAFIGAANALLDNVANNDEVRGKLARRGRTDAKLQIARGQVAAFETSYQAQQANKAATRDATNVQSEAFKALRAWFVEFSRFARLALKGQRALLDQILPPARQSAAPSSGSGEPAPSPSPQP